MKKCICAALSALACSVLPSLGKPGGDCEVQSTPWECCGPVGRANLVHCSGWTCEIIEIESDTGRSLLNGEVGWTFLDTRWVDCDFYDVAGCGSQFGECLYEPTPVTVQCLDYFVSPLSDLCFDPE